MTDTGTVRRGSAPAALPWEHREETEGSGAPATQPRSERDAELLRGLAQRIPPEDPNAHNNLGVVYYHKALFPEAAEQFERALALEPRLHVAERNLRIVYFATGYFERLESEARARLEENPADAALRERLARAYFHAGDGAAAAREWRVLTAARPRDPDGHLMLARSELRAGDYDAALTALRQALALEPARPGAHLLLGEIHYRQGRLREALGALEEALRRDEELAEAHHLLGFVCRELGDGVRAEEAAARAAELKPSLARDEANLSLDGYSTARYEELVGGGPEAMVGEGHLAHYHRGVALRQRARFDDALREFRLATERGEDPFLVDQAEAEMLLLRGQAEAVTAYEGLTRRERSSPKLWNELGVARHQQGDLEGATAAYRRGLELDDAYVLAQNNLAVAELHRGRPAEAEALLRGALERGRATADVACNLGLLLRRAGRRAQAEAAYRAAVQAEPEAALAWAGLGAVLLEGSDAAAARDALFRAVELDAALAEARYNLAFALSALGDYDGALRETRRALEANPYIPAPRHRLLIDLQYEEASVPAPELGEVAPGPPGPEVFDPEGADLDTIFVREGGEERAAPPAADTRSRVGAAQSALHRGDLDTALREALRLIREGSARVEGLLLQGEAYLRSGAAGEAVERFEAALGELAGGAAVAGADRDGETALGRALLGAARSLLQLGRPREAVDAAERLTELFPGDVVALRTLAEGLGRVGDHRRAVLALEEALDAGPADPGLLTQLGRAALEAGEVTRAERALRDAIRRGGDAPAARAALARVLARHGDADGAAAEYRAALGALPSYGEAALGLAALEAERGRLREAIGALVDFLTVDPYHVPGLLRLAEVLERVGLTEKARVAYGRVLRFAPGERRAAAALHRLGSAVGGGGA